MKLFDTHCHINLDPLIDQEQEIIKTCQEENVLINIVAADLETARIAVRQAQQNDHVYATVGIHPNDVKVNWQDDLDQIEKLIQENKKVIAIGETGLDIHYENYDLDLQKASFKAHLTLGQKYNLPVVIHVRDCHQEVIKFLKQYKMNDQKVIIHSCTANKEEIIQYIAMNCYISFSGMITFKNAQAIKEAAKLVDVNYLLVETDSPWLAPVPLRGKINQPNWVYYVLKGLAEVRNEDFETLAKKVFENSLRVFNLKIMQ